MCNIPEFPPPLDIAPGLSHLPRQWADFAQFRQALLTGIGRPEHAAALGRWRADGPNDLGLMLIEMAAWLGDALAFYDEVHAHECYLRTARRSVSVRELVARLGYRPRPALAALAELALLVDGRSAVVLPAGTAFRSGSFGTEKPQVFELDAAASAHPAFNRWSVAAPRPIAVDDAGGPGASATRLRLDADRSARWAEGDLVLIQPDPLLESTWQVRQVGLVEQGREPDGRRWLDLTVAGAAVSLGAGRALAGVRLLRPTRQVGLWLQPDISAVSESAAPTQLTLDAVHRDLRSADLVLVACTAAGREGQRWFRVTEATETGIEVPLATDADGQPITGLLPATRLTLDADIDDPTRGSTFDWDDVHASQLQVFHGLRDAARLAAPAQAQLPPDAPLALLPPVTVPIDASTTVRFAMQDADDQALAFGGVLDLAQAALSPWASDTPRPTLNLPVQVWGNLAVASRGETVISEVLGSGDPTQAHQAFTLKKSPLTYLPSATAPEGYASTLQVWVDGLLWTERPSAYGVGPQDRIYTVSLDEQGVATLHFGGGARLPSGRDNVVARYRHGAGSAAPPAGSLQQIVRGQAGLRAVRQPLSAHGGADAEAADALRTGAPRQALTLGRAVSLLDLQAHAAACSGVAAVRVDWAWDAAGARPVARVWVATEAVAVEADVASAVRARLLAITEPGTPIVVSAALATPVELNLSLSVDAEHIGSTVEDAVATALLAPPAGLLCVQQLGIGASFAFSRLAQAVHAVEGVVSMQMQWSRAGVAVAGWGDRPGEGAWFDFRAGVLINAKVHTHAG